jgi:hypothetical protein
MGGPGSGRPPSGRNRKVETDAYPALDIRALKQAGWLSRSPHKRRTHPMVWTREATLVAIGMLVVLGRPNRSPFKLRLCFGAADENGEPYTASDDIRLAYTPCRYGGCRAWFRCPLCEERKAVLWLAGGLISCRRCQNLVYSSTREGALDRACRRAHRARARLGAGHGSPVVCPPKPNGMHWLTYLRYREQILRTAPLFRQQIDALELSCARLRKSS